MKREIKKAENDRTGRVGQSRQEGGDSQKIESESEKWGRERPNGQRKDWRNAYKTRK